MCFEKYFENAYSKAICFMITLISVLKSVDKAFFENVLKCFCVGVKSLFEQASNNYLLYSKGSLFSSFPLDNVILLLLSR